MIDLRFDRLNHVEEAVQDEPHVDVAGYLTLTLFKRKAYKDRRG